MPTFSALRPELREQEAFLCAALPQERNALPVGRLATGRLASAISHFYDSRPYPDSQAVSEFVEAHTWPMLHSQSIAPGVLAEPLYRFQGDGQGSDPDSDIVSLGCMNACFRMLFDTITGQRADEQLLGRYMLAIVGQDRYKRVEDHHYLNLLNHEAFRRFSARPIAATYIGGATFSAIAQVARHMYKKQAGTETYCVTSLQSEVDDTSTHNVILLGVDEEWVLCHDPALASRGAARRRINKRRFSELWCGGSNTAMLVSVGPSPRPVLNPNPSN